MGRFLWVTVLFVTLGGCAAPAPAAFDLQSSSAATAEPIYLRTKSLDMTLEAGVTGAAPSGLPIGHAWMEAGGSGHLSIDLAPAAHALLVELAVQEGDGKLLLHVLPPTAVQQTPLLADADTYYAAQAQDGSARLVLERPIAGTWHVDAHADGLARAMRFTVYATSFAGPIPEGFTAIQ